MSVQSKQADPDVSETAGPASRKLVLKSGHKVVLRSQKGEELIQLNRADGQVLMEIRITPDGPVLSLSGIRLDLSAVEEICLDARKIKINAREQVDIRSQGACKITTRKNINVTSSKDIKLKSEVIHLN